MANTFVHVELSTDDVGGARKFYGKVFDWKFTQLGAEMGNYVMVDLGTKTQGGGLTPKMMPNQPTAWLPYVEVADVKKTIAKAKKAGATILVEFQPVGDMGAIGIFMDPTGAALGVWAPNKKPAKKAAKKKAAKKKAAKKK
jgi:uncharacterized protein